MIMKDKIVWPSLANEQIIKYLEKSILENNPEGSYVFSGPDNIGKSTVAKSFAQILLCKNKGFLPCGVCESCRRFTIKDNEEYFSHGDFTFVTRAKDKKNISIEQIRDFIRVLNMSSFAGGYKIGVVKHAELLSTEAANALLKTLEEPKEKTIIILISSEAELLPTTILSRCKILYFKPVMTEKIYDYLVKERNVSREKARNLSRLSLGRPALAIKFLEDEEFYDFYNNNVEDFLHICGSGINERLMLVEELTGKEKGQAGTRIAHRVIEIWQGVCRDWLLLLLGQNNYVQHIYLADEIKHQGIEYTEAEIVRLSKLLSRAHLYLKANVSPRLVLENIVLNF